MIKRYLFLFLTLFAFQLHAGPPSPQRSKATGLDESNQRSETLIQSLEQLVNRKQDKQKKLLILENEALFSLEMAVRAKIRSDCVLGLHAIHKPVIPGMQKTLLSMRVKLEKLTDNERNQQNEKIETFKSSCKKLAQAILNSDSALVDEYGSIVHAVKRNCIRAEWIEGLSEIYQSDLSGMDDIISAITAQLPTLTKERLS